MEVYKQGWSIHTVTYFGTFKHFNLHGRRRLLLCPRPGGIKRWCCLTSVCLTSVAYIRSAGGVCGRPAGWRVLVDRARLGRPGSRLPLRASVVGLGGGISWRPPAYSLFNFCWCVQSVQHLTCYCSHVLTPIWSKITNWNWKIITSTSTTRHADADCYILADP